VAHRERARRPRAGQGGSLYGWIWRHLPGPLAVRLLVALLLLAAAVAVLWAVAFPALEPLLPFDDSAVE
jgi:hypothetical protein